MDGNNLVASNSIRNEHLQNILKRYELSATNSLGGPAAMSGATGDTAGQRTVPNQVHCKPSSAAVSTALATFMLQREESAEERNTAVDQYSNMGTFFDDFLSLRHAIPVQPCPILLQNDRASTACEKQETILEGEYICCFSVGGEKRLCLPQVLNTVLKECSVVDINRARTELNIHCSYGTLEQLQVLKLSGVLASTANSCSLITKTDAERLCNYLLRQKRGDGKNVTGRSSSVEKQRSRRTSLNGRIDSAQLPGPFNGDVNGDVNVPVMHLCFGRCRGRYWPHFYASPSAECIECDECGDMFAPDRFVMHSHRNQERRICHWGFDSANWRAYIHLPADAKLSEENVKILNQMKLRFDVTGLTKRRFEEHVVEPNSLDVPNEDNQRLKKRLKLEHDEEKTSVKTNFSCSVQTAGAKEQPSWLYFLYDPMFFATYCQTLLSAAVNGRTTQQQSTSTGSYVAPQLIPAASFGSGPCHIDGKLLDGLSTKCSYSSALHTKQQLQPIQSQLRDASATQSDEATAVAALKLLQLRATNVGDNGCLKDAVSRLRDTAQRTNGFEGAKTETASCCTSANAPSTPSPPSAQQRTTYRTASKESYKKHLLHLFSAEQQQKQQFLDLQQRPLSPSLQGRASVEVIVDDPGEEGECRRRGEALLVTESLQTSPCCDEEQCDVADGRMSEETQIADESVASASGSQPADQPSSLDDLLERYVDDEAGLRAIRKKIAINQRYLEQKLESVLSENRLLRAECVQLRYRLHEQMEPVKQSVARAPLLGV